MGVLVTLNVTWKVMKLDYLPTAITEGHMIPEPDTLEVWRTLHKNINYTHLFEIGLNAGHSAAMNLTLFPDIKVTSLDIGHHPYTRIAANSLKEKFGDRFEYIECDSLAYASRVYDGRYDAPEGVDSVFIDGRHDWIGILSDIGLSKFFNIQDVIIDNTDRSWKSINHVLEQMKRLQILELVENYKYTGIMQSDTVKCPEQLSHYRFL